MSRVKTARLVELHLALVHNADTSIYTRDELREYGKRTQHYGGQANCKRACISMAHTVVRKWRECVTVPRRYLRNTVTHAEHVQIMRHHRSSKVRRIVTL
jgi:hypothetical protein